MIGPKQWIKIKQTWISKYEVRQIKGANQMRRISKHQWTFLVKPTTTRNKPHKTLKEDLRMTKAQLRITAILKTHVTGLKGPTDELNKRDT